MPSLPSTHLSTGMAAGGWGPFVGGGGQCLAGAKLLRAVFRAWCPLGAGPGHSPLCRRLPAGPVASSGLRPPRGRLPQPPGCRQLSPSSLPSQSSSQPTAPMVHTRHPFSAIASAPRRPLPRRIGQRSRKPRPAGSFPGQIEPPSEGRLEASLPFYLTGESLFCRQFSPLGLSASSLSVRV